MLLSEKNIKEYLTSNFLLGGTDMNNLTEGNGMVVDNTYTFLGNLSRIYIRLSERGEKDNIEYLNSFILDVYNRGDSYVQEAIMLGFLESLSNSPDDYRKVKNNLPIKFQKLVKLIDDFWMMR